MRYLNCSNSNTERNSQAGQRVNTTWATPPRPHEGDCPRWVHDETVARGRRSDHPPTADSEIGMEAGSSSSPSDSGAPDCDELLLLSQTTLLIGQSPSLILTARVRTAFTHQSPCVYFDPHLMVPDPNASLQRGQGQRI